MSQDLNWKAVEVQRDLLGIKVVDCGHVLISTKNFDEILSWMRSKLLK